MTEKSLIMVIDNLIVCAAPSGVSKPEYVHLLKCPGCLKRETFVPIADIIQQGFFENECRTVFECQNCTYQVYVRYQVPVYEVAESEKR